MFKYAIRNIKRVYLFTIAPRMWRGRVKHSLSPKLDKSHRLMVTGNSSKEGSWKGEGNPPRRKEDSERTRLKAQRIINYVFGKGEFPYDDIPAFKNDFGAHEDQLTQIFAPQVHFKDETKAQKLKTDAEINLNKNKSQDMITNASDLFQKKTQAPGSYKNLTFVQKVEKFFETDVDKYGVAKLYKTIRPQSSMSEEPIAKDKQPTMSNTKDKYEEHSTLNDIHQPITGADLAEAAKAVANKAPKHNQLEKPTVMPIYPGHIKKLYSDPYKNPASDQSKFCNEMNKILNKHEEELLKDLPKSYDITELTEYIPTKIKLAQKRKPNECNKKLKKLSRFQPQGGPFSLQKKLQLNLKKHMEALKSVENNQKAIYSGSKKVADSKGSYVDLKSGAVFDNNCLSDKEQTPNKSIDYTEAATSDIKSKGVENINEDSSNNKNAETISCQSKKDRANLEPHSPPVNASTAGGIMYSETCPSATSEKSSPVTRNETSRFENPRDLDVDIEPVFRSKSDERVLRTVPRKQKPVNFIQETMDIVKKVMEESKPNSSAINSDVHLDLNLRNLIESPISNLDPNKAAILTASQATTKREAVNKIKSERKAKEVGDDDADLSKPDLDKEYVKEIEINLESIDSTKIEKSLASATESESSPEVEIKRKVSDNVNLHREQRGLLMEPVLESIGTPEIKATIVPALKSKTKHEPQVEPDILKETEKITQMKQTPHADMENDVPMTAELTKTKLDPVEKTSQEKLSELLKEIRERSRMQKAKLIEHILKTKKLERFGAVFLKKGKNCSDPPQPICPNCFPPCPPRCPPCPPCPCPCRYSCPPPPSSSGCPPRPCCPPTCPCCTPPPPLCPPVKKEPPKPVCPPPTPPKAPKKPKCDPCEPPKKKDK